MKTHDQEHDLMMRVIFGDKESGELGMKEKVDDMHKILIASQNVGGFFGKIGVGLKWLLVIAAVVGIIRGWWIGLLTFLIK